MSKRLPNLIETVILDQARYILDQDNFGQELSDEAKILKHQVLALLVSHAPAAV